MHQDVTPTDLSAILKRTLGDKLQRLAKLCPSDLKAIELIVNDILIQRWPTNKHLH